MVITFAWSPYRPGYFLDVFPWVERDRCCMIPWSVTVPRGRGSVAVRRLKGIDNPIRVAEREAYRGNSDPVTGQIIGIGLRPTMSAGRSTLN